MATEGHILSEAVEPSPLATAKGVATGEPRLNFSARLEALPAGRALLGCMQWAVVLGLVVTGFFGAEVIHNGVQLATRTDAPNTAQILAASAPRN